MRKILLLFLMLFTIKTIGQNNINIKYTNGNLLTIPLSAIDSINYLANPHVCPNTVSDVDGNLYNTVLIGTQCWMKENLKTTHYKNGTPIQTGFSDSAWSVATVGGYADYNNDTLISMVYGRLYNWYAVADPAGLCPANWHEPEDWEWNVLAKAIDPNADTTNYNNFQSVIAGGAIKEVGITHWASPNTGATDSIGFTGLPSGSRYYNSYCCLGYIAFWWSATEISPISRSRKIYYNLSDFYGDDFGKSFGFSVRCIKN